MFIETLKRRKLVKRPIPYSSTRDFNKLRSLVEETDAPL